jgi:hypothetical protein
VKIPGYVAAMRRIGILVIVAATAAVVAAVALAAQSPKHLRAAMLAAASARHSVHYVSVTSAGGHSIRIVSDVGRGLGIQRFAIKIGSQSGPATVLVVGGSAYIQGNAFTLHSFFPFTKAQATKYAGQWISIPSTSGAFSTVAADATFASFLGDLLPTQHLSSVRATVGGRKAVGLRGNVRQGNLTLVQTVYAPASGTPLPFEEKAVAAQVPGPSIVRISRWNEAVHVTAPANAVPITTVVGH